MSYVKYTPDTEEVQDQWARMYADHDYHKAVDEFGRWVAQVKAEAWDEGFLLATRNNPKKPHPMLSYNPYRKEGS